MYNSNRLAREYLLKHGFDSIWLKAHLRRKDRVFTQAGMYLATDLWNLFDGIAFREGILYFLQIKTNAWAKEQPILDFLQKHVRHSDTVKALVINVRKKKGRWKITTRFL
jgi:hypothetical protein